MSQKAITPEMPEGTEEAIDGMRSLMESLVPPDDVTITDIFGTEYTVTTKISARSQIKIIRELESFADLDLGVESVQELSLPTILFKVAGNEDLLEMVGRCMKIAFPLVVSNAESVATEKGIPYEEPSAIDLFSVEEVVSAIVPLFLRVAKKTGSVLTILSTLTS